MKKKKWAALSSMKIPKPKAHLACFQKTVLHLHHPQSSELVEGGGHFHVSNRSFQKVI